MSFSKRSNFIHRINRTPYWKDAYKRNDYRTVALSGMVGAIILLVADCFARSLTSSELPISILTTFIGAPFLAYLMIRIRS